MSTPDSQPPSNAGPGADQPGPEAPDIVNQARRIGLQPTVAYVPLIQVESVAERKKRLKRERARKKRSEAQARGFQQINIPAVPTELVEAVRFAVTNVLAGQPNPAPESATPRHIPSGIRSKWIIAIVLVVIAAFGFAAGMSTRMLQQLQQLEYTNTTAGVADG